MSTEQKYNKAIGFLQSILIDEMRDNDGIYNEEIADFLTDIDELPLGWNNGINETEDEL